MTQDTNPHCANCGQPITDVVITQHGRPYHQTDRHCLAAALARAETAEDELEAERETSAETNGFIDELIAALDHPIRGDEVFLPEIIETAVALKTRVSKLETALDSANAEITRRDESVTNAIAGYEMTWRKLEICRARIAELEAATPSPQCAYCNQPAVTVRTYYALGLPACREYLCAPHAASHPYGNDGAVLIPESDEPTPYPTSAEETK